MSKRRMWVLGSVAAIVLLAIGGGAVMAQSDEESPAGTFLDRVAEKLGIEPDRLEQAIEDTRNEDIDAAVANGDLTQEQADRLKERLAEKGGHLGPGFPPFGKGRGGWAPHPGAGHGFGFGFGLPGAIDDLADFLGIEDEQLKDELAAEGATLATVAEAHGKSRDELKAFITQELDERLSEAVEDGKLSQERADEIKGKVETALDEIIDRSFPGRGEHGFGLEFRFHAPPDGQGSEDGEGTPDTQSGSTEGSHRS